MQIDHDLVRRVEHSAARLGKLQTNALASLASARDAVARPLDGGALVAFGEGRYVNRAIGLGLGGTPADQLVAALTAFYVGLGLPPSLELSPWADESLLAALAADGYRLERFRSVFAHDLQSLPPAATAPIVEVDAHSEHDRKRILSGDAPLGSVARQRSDEFCDAMALLPHKADLVALVDGSAAACGSLTIVDDVGWLGGAATDERHRGRGLQSALLSHRLHLAARSGCTLAAATALPDGQSARNLARLGFTLLYTQAVLTRA
jgi:GNAT superfamily N-acetyltransferase